MDIGKEWDKYKENGIILENLNPLKWSKEVVRMAENDLELLNAVYQEIGEKLGMDTAVEVYRMFRGQQISFPVHLFDPARIREIIAKEYDGANIRALAARYRHSLPPRELFPRTRNALACQYCGVQSGMPS